MFRRSVRDGEEVENENSVADQESASLHDGQELLEIVAEAGPQYGTASVRPADTELATGGLAGSWELGAIQSEEPTAETADGPVGLSETSGRFMAESIEYGDDADNDSVSVDEISDVAGRDIPELERIRDVLRRTATGQVVGKNSGSVIGIQLNVTFERMLEQQTLDDELLATVRSGFQPPQIIHRHGTPARYEELVQHLSRPGAVVVLSGGSGCGRTITGLALLAHLRTLTEINVSTLTYGGAPSFSPRQLSGSKRHAYLLELPVDDDEFEISRDFGYVLYEVQQRLERASSSLVIITTEEQWQRIGANAPVQPVELKPPLAIEIARSWLRVTAPDIPVDQWLAHEEIKKLLSGETPRGAMEIVSLITKAALAPLDTASPDGSPGDKDQVPIDAGDSVAEFNDRVSSVVDARRSWRTELSKWHKAPDRTSVERNFLLVAAALGSAPAGEVFAATALLMRQFNESSLGGQMVGQQGPGVLQLVDAIKARLSDDDSIEFTRPGWEDAVVSYFWIDRPLSRDGFLSWLAQVPVMSSKDLEGISLDTSDAERKRRAQRVTRFLSRWVVRQRRPDYFEKVIAAWNDEKGVWPVAMDMLTDASLDPVIGRDVHRTLLRWAQFGTPALQKAVAEVCGGHFGRAYQAKALVRLGHVAKSEHLEVAEVARRAMVRLFREPSVQAGLFSQVLKWCRSNEQTRRNAGRQAFIALAELQDDALDTIPVLLTTGTQEALNISPELLADGWRTALESPKARIEAKHAAQFWFDACVAHLEIKEMIFKVFRLAVVRGESVEGGHDGRHLRFALHDMLYEWQPPSEDLVSRVEIRQTLVDLLMVDVAHVIEQFGKV